MIFGGIQQNSVSIIHHSQCSQCNPKSLNTGKEKGWWGERFLLFIPHVPAHFEFVMRYIT